MWGDLSLEVEAVVPALLLALQHTDSRFRVAAAQALWDVARQADAVVPVLIEVLQEKTTPPDVRREAVWALEFIGPLAEAAVPALLELLRKEPGNLHREAGKALDIGLSAAGRLPGLDAAWQEESAYLRQAAADALKRIDPGAAAGAGVRGIDPIRPWSCP